MKYILLDKKNDPYDFLYEDYIEEDIENYKPRLYTRIDPITKKEIKITNKEINGD